MRRGSLHLTRISLLSNMRGRIRIAASALALFALLPALGIVALQSAPSARAASGCGVTQACIHWDGSMIYPNQNTGNPEGPVGEHALVHGEGFLANASQQIQLQVVKGDVNNIGGQSPVEFCKLSTPKVPVGQAQVDATGKFDFTFDWPAAASTGDWSICAYGPDGLPVLNGNIDDGPFRVLSANPPSIALSTDGIQPGKSVTITGQSWLPAQGGIFVYIGPCADCDSPPIVSTTLSSSGAGGNFSVTLPIPSNTAPGTYIASAHNTNQQGSVLDLINNGPKLTVAAAAPTATTAPSPAATATRTPTATATRASAGNGSGNTSASNGSGSNTGLLIGLVVAIVVLLAALAGMLAYLATQRRNASPSGPGGYGPPVGAGANTNPAGRYGPPDPFAAPYHPPATPPPLPDWDPGATTDPGDTAPDDAPTQAGFFPPPADPHGR